MSGAVPERTAVHCSILSVWCMNNQWLKCHQLKLDPGYDTEHNIASTSYIEAMYRLCVLGSCLPNLVPLFLTKNLYDDIL